MNTRIHLIAIAVIILLLVMVYVFSNRKGPTGPDDVPISIEVVNASYGLNCQQPISNAQEPVYKDDSNSGVRRNNVLVVVSKLCNGQPSCQFQVNEETLHNNPLASCYKELEIDYRCFSYDRLRTVRVLENNIISLTCPAQIK